MLRLNLLQHRHLAACLPLLLAAIGSVSVPAVAQDEGNLYDTPFDVSAGESYFQRQCTRCHGQDAKGNDETGAPDLTGSLRRASSDAGIFSIIRQGIAGTAMLPVPIDTPDPTVWQLVAYINSLRTDPANIDLPGDPAAGLALYNGKGDCARCHMINGRGGRLGPDLTLVGEQLDPEELKTALTVPDEDVAPRWWTVRVTQRDGSVVEGLRMDEDTFGLRVIDADANLWSFRKNEIDSFEVNQSSTMPSYTRTLTENEIDHLVAYLFSLRKEN
ncbi:MAG: c-type cytochrome [Gammaproteobacteria bacterium]|nr:c-type cytochrome [Pseudomonadales bacterium]MCP5348102.1 c-type cytochrome [Pseudomonadales bacterium]